MTMKKMLVCDVCGRSPNGISPDCVYCLACGHDLCDECYGQKQTCPICDGTYQIGRPVKQCDVKTATEKA